MQETIITLKSLSSLSASTSSREDFNQGFVKKKLSRCVQRKYTTYNSQLPIRCQRSGRHYRLPRPCFRLINLPTINAASAINSAKSCPDSSTCSYFRVIGSPRCKKSLSMTDLSPIVIDIENGDVRSESSSIIEKFEDSNKSKDIGGNEMGISIGIKKWMDGFMAPDPEEGSSGFVRNPKRAASIACHYLMLNAWRRRRNEVDFLHSTIDDLTQQVDHLHLQIVVLRRLLEKENSRNTKLTNEIYRGKLRYDEIRTERDSTKSEKEKMEAEVKRLTELSEERLVAAENVRNELLTAQDQLQALDEQISKDREKLLKLREDKRILLEKVTACEILAAERERRAEKAETLVEDLQSKLAIQISLVESSRERIERDLKELRTKEDEKSRLIKRLKSSEEIGKTLNLRSTSLEAQLADRESALQRMQAVYNSQLTELNELKERLIRQSQEGGWSSRMLQIAGSVVRAPRAILRTLLASPVLT